MEAVQAQFVDHQDVADSLTRAMIWSDFQRATGKLREVIPVCAIWIGGSFVSAKVDPSDIDVIYIVSAHGYAQLQDDKARRRVALFSKAGELKAKGIRVDSYVLNWTPIAEPHPDNPAHTPYLKWRGYWDDFLQRHTLDKNQPLDRLSSVPARGYLEVIADGFSA